MNKTVVAEGGDYRPVSEKPRQQPERLRFREDTLIMSDYSSRFLEFQFEELRLRDYSQPMLDESLLQLENSTVFRQRAAALAQNQATINTENALREFRNLLTGTPTLSIPNNYVEKPQTAQEPSLRFDISLISPSGQPLDTNKDTRQVVSELARASGDVLVLNTWRAEGPQSIPKNSSLYQQNQSLQSQYQQLQQQYALGHPTVQRSTRIYTARPTASQHAMEQTSRPVSTIGHRSGSSLMTRGTLHAEGDLSLKELMNPADQQFLDAIS